MNILIIMIPISLCLGLGFLVLFIWSVNKGQMDDLVTPAYQALNDTTSIKQKHKDIDDE